MKILVIYPDTDVTTDSLFTLLDPETGEELASHFCSAYYFAKSDLHDTRKDRKIEWEKKFGEETEAKFISETKYTLEDILEKNNNFYKTK